MRVDVPTNRLRRRTGAVGRQIVLLAMQLGRLPKEGLVQWLGNVRGHHPEQPLAPLALLALISRVRVKHTSLLHQPPALFLVVNKAIAALPIQNVQRLFNALMEENYEQIMKVLHAKTHNVMILIVANQPLNRHVHSINARVIQRKKKIRVIAQAEYAPMKSAVHKIPNPRAHMIILLALLIMKMFYLEK